MEIAMRIKGNVLTVMLVVALVAGHAGVRAFAGDTDVAIGEQHEMPFPADQTLDLVEDVLRGEGILFDVLPDKMIVTLWKPADNKAGFFRSLGGMKPQYRYEITVVPRGGAKSNIVANVRTEYVPEDQIASYMASRRFDMFHKLDQLAATLPPERKAPSTGGVNFAAAAKRRSARSGQPGDRESRQLEDYRRRQRLDLPHRRDPVSDHLGAGHDNQVQARGAGRRTHAVTR